MRLYAALPWHIQEKSGFVIPVTKEKIAAHARV
jgi:hypothetical protein